MGPWILFSVQWSGIQHRLPLSLLALNGLVAAIISALWFLVRVKRPVSLAGGLAMLLGALVIWNLPSYALLPPKISAVEPYLLMVVVAALYRFGIGRTEIIRRWVDDPGPRTSKFH